MERTRVIKAEVHPGAAQRQRTEPCEIGVPLTAADRCVRAALIDSIARDLARPFALISGATTNLKNRYVADEAERALIAVIDEEIGHLETFAELLADLARIESGAIGVRRENISLNDVVDLVVDDATLAARGREVQFHLPHDSLSLSVDPAILHKVLTLLIANAARQSPPGSTIAVQAGTTSGFLRLQVVDEGNGIDPGRLATLFDQHRLPCRDREAGFDGDLRLALCRAFVQAIGGTITASNRTDRTGAVFTITFAAET